VPATLGISPDPLQPVADVIGCMLSALHEQKGRWMIDEQASSPITDQQRRYARMAGLALLLICLSALLSNNLIVAGDAVATANNIFTHERWFRVGIAGELFMANCDIVLAVALYVVLKPISPPFALIGMLWRFANAALLCVGVVVSIVALDILDDTHYLTAFRSDQAAALARELFNIHGTAMAIGLVLFALGAATHAFLLWTARYLPRPLSGAYFIVTLLIALSCSAVIVWPSLDTIIDPWLIAPDFFVELAVAAWLLFRGIEVRSNGTMPMSVAAASGRSWLQNERQ
jgi:hypothetical protein